MCLVLIAHQLSEQTPLLVLANRDEFYARPTRPAEEWPEAPGLIAGRDLVSGGTWFGARNHRWATVTNIREGVRDKDAHSKKSRGWLVRDYLQSELSPQAFMERIEASRDDFSGFNLLLGDRDKLCYASNREAGYRPLGPGIYGLSNHRLDTPWPKVSRGKAALASLCKNSDIDPDQAFDLLADRKPADDAQLPHTGVPLEWERALSAIFSCLPTYGTRSSTLFLAGADQKRHFIERRFKKGGVSCGVSSFSWPASGVCLTDKFPE